MKKETEDTVLNFANRVAFFCYFGVFIFVVFLVLVSATKLLVPQSEDFALIERDGQQYLVAMIETSGGEFVEAEIPMEFAKDVFIYLMVVFALLLVGIFLPKMLPIFFETGLVEQVSPSSEM